MCARTIRKSITNKKKGVYYVEYRRNVVRNERKNIAVKIKENGFWNLMKIIDTNNFEGINNILKYCIFIFCIKTELLIKKKSFLY